MNKKEQELLEAFRESYYDLANRMAEFDNEVKGMCIDFLLNSNMSKKDKDTFKQIFEKYIS